VYATGDGGWHRKDLDLYRHLVTWGYPVAGFDAHDYVKHLGTEPTTTPERVAHDYQTMIDAAREALALPRALPVVLVGVSRGAGLAVVAAGDPSLRAELSGVVVVGLTKEEEYVHWYRRLESHRSEMVQIYEYLPSLALLPITVIQSTRDKYLPAASARALFGPDGPDRHLIAIDARNHSFGGARDALYAALESTLDSMSRTDLTQRMQGR
jgi:pimeloyl-ACP methyl ester carboxylesterase